MSFWTENTPTQSGAPSAALDTVMRYHQQTKHHFSHYARSLGYMDWANQPNPFRRYLGAPVVPLPLLPPDEPPRSPSYADLYRPGAIASAPVTVRTLSRFLEYALAISAWKQAGAARWALRSNPSSGNLHPTEGYLLVGAVPDLAPHPGLYHYAPKEHALELRAAWPPESFDSLLRGFPPHAFLIGFASVNWRETWKYGERAFRYCQHDVGHALASARVAAQTLGWLMLLLDGLADDTAAGLLGVNRTQDFAGAEAEHPDCLAVVWPAVDPAGGAAAEMIAIPPFLDAQAMLEPSRIMWHGKANRLSRDDPVQWPILDQVASASWKTNAHQPVVYRPRRTAASPIDPPHRPAGASAGCLIRQRRSALAFDGVTAIARESFYAMLARVVPPPNCDPSERPMPWDMLPWPPAVHLALFVHRVAGLASGMYMLARDPARVDALKRAMHSDFGWIAPPDRPQDLPLFLLEAGDARQLAAQVSCGQDIAGDGAFALGMIAEFEPSLQRYGPWFYRRLFWETGVIGQVLYLEAEASGIRATGIGCFFDDPVHQVLGFKDATFQSLYHFTVGGPVDDPRLTTLPAYGPDR